MHKFIGWLEFSARVALVCVLLLCAPGPQARALGAPVILLSVDAAAGRKPISAGIYGLNFAKEAFANEIGLPLRRWGGNATSRYNWQTGNTSTGRDWYFENVTQYDPYTGAAEGHTQWIAQNMRTGSDSLLTVPTLGYVARDSTGCSFSQAKYGSQQSYDQPWRPDCGNGLKPDGSLLTGNDPLDASQVSTPLIMKNWVQNLVSAYGTAAMGGVKYYALDNEPDLWGDTHRDVHPAPQSYDELLAKTKSYAAAIKAADPSAQILGYASFGWTGYWYSELDTLTAASNGYTYFPDYQTHGSQYQVPWYLSQLKQYEQTYGVRLLDYLDLHYYPESGVSLTTAGSAATQALRLRSTRSLWDPTYMDESWIGGADQPADWRAIRLLPRMRDWVSTYYPGTKLAITEYNFGGLEQINGALAQADVLGIFGREGLDLATLWNYPLLSGDPLGYDHFESLPGSYAFRMYRNYDGAAGRFGDTSVHAASADQSKLAIYTAQRASDSALTIMLVNKSGQTQSASLGLANFSPAATAQVYRYSAANLSAIQHLADQPLTPAGFSADIPANSISLYVIPNAAATTFADVSAAYWAWQPIETLARNGITSGCGPGLYCPEDSVTRAQMAVFLLKSKNGPAYLPALPAGLFSDVPASHWAAAWIESLATAGITSGCGPGLYCPEDSVTRAQMAVFLLRAGHAAGYTPPLPSGVFSDVPASHWAAGWIEQLAAEGITSGCGQAIYCPESPVTRAQMAVFLVRAFGLK